MEDVIAGDGMLGACDGEVGGSCASGNYKIFSLYLVVLWVVRVQRGKLPGFDELPDQLCIFRTDDGFFVLEGGQTVEVVHVIHFVDIGHVSKIDRFDICLYFGSQLVPVEMRGNSLIPALVDSQLPAVVMGINQFLVVFGSLVHQLLRNASHVHAGPP